MSDDFLSRWSRRKDEARRKTERAPAEPAGDPGQPAAEPALAPEEIASLPRIEELTGETDITGFLRPGVPAALRNAALRKMWLLDPAIRDFPGHARDYAYDWNTPESVPGNGLLPSRDEVAAMAQRVLGTPETTPSERAADAVAADRADAGAAAEAHQETARDETKPPSRG